MPAQSSMDFLAYTLRLGLSWWLVSPFGSPSASWREKASLSPFQRSLRSLPPLLGLCPATKGAIPLGTPAALLRKPANLTPLFFSQGSGCMLRSPYERGANRARFPRWGNRSV